MSDLVESEAEPEADPWHAACTSFLLNNSGGLQSNKQNFKGVGKTEVSDLVTLMLVLLFLMVVVPSCLVISACCLLLHTHTYGLLLQKVAL